MNARDALAWLGRLLGVVGLAVCAVSGIARLAGRYMLDRFPVVTLFQGGVALLVAGCFFLLLVVVTRR
ncbi:MAG TPA: hypothetical protein VLG08_07960 [Casimicrobiaceae bacterium]|jgi:hypothetical protein|nr:hypothetical protein [Casimicrobiaceae bacterium]